MASSKTQIRRVKSVGLTEIPEQSNGKDGVKLQDKYEMFSIPDNSNGEFIQVRQFGGFVATKTHWVTLEGKEGKMFSVPKTCLAFDPETMSNSDAPCPYCEAEIWFRDHEIKVKAGKGEGNPARGALEYVTNAIIRDIQEDITPKITKDEERDSGIIEKGSKSKTPVRVIRLTPGVITKIKDVEKLNVHKVKLKGEDSPSRRAMPVGHIKYGIDLNIKFNPKAKAASDYYAVQRGDASPLTDEEQEYLRWDIEAWPFENEAESLADAQKELARLKGKHWDRFRKHAGVEDESDDYEDDEDLDDEDEDEDDEDEAPRKKSSKKAPAKSKKKSRRDEDEDDEDEDDLDLDDEDEDEDDEDEDERPAKKKTSAPKASGKKSSKKSSRDEDEDEDDDLDLDDDEDDEDEDEDEAPRKKSSKKPAAKSKKKVVDEDEDDDLDDEDDEDEDDDLDDEDDEDERPAKKSAKKPAAKSKKKVVDEDEDDDLDDEDEDEDEDDDLDDDEDDEDERPAKKSSKKAPAKKPAKKSRRDEDEDEDDDLDLDDDEDEDDEDERPAKKSATKKKARR